MQCGVPIPTTSKTLKSTINPKKYDGILVTTTSSNLRSLNDLTGGNKFHIQGVP